MKKMLALVLTLLLCVCFAGCKEETPVEPPALTFPKTEKVMPIQRLVITESGGKLEGVGFVQEDTESFCLSGRYMDGDARQEGKLFYYDVPKAFSELREKEKVDGVLIFDGIPYGACVGEDGTAAVYTLDGDAQPWSDFFSDAYESKNR